MFVSKSATMLLCALSVSFVTAVCRAEDAKEPEKVLRHTVFFKFKDGTSDEDTQKIVSAFDALPKKIDTIKGYQRGKNVSEEGLDDGFTHCFLVTFADEAGRAKYLPHPEHKAFAELAKPHVDQVFVIDYWGKPEKARTEREFKRAVFLKFKDSATEEQTKDLIESIAKLPSQCDAIKGFEWGTNNSPETHDEGFTHCFMFTFDNPEGLKELEATSAHRIAADRVEGLAEKGRVLDFWTKDKEK
jgi:hypothetical protein